jgi:hypothetical protein
MRDGDVPAVLRRLRESLELLYVSQTQIVEGADGSLSLQQNPQLPASAAPSRL